MPKWGLRPVTEIHEWALQLVQMRMGVGRGVVEPAHFTYCHAKNGTKAER